ncbi:MAG: Primosomal protein N' [Chlamydiae bacterium]|nr:Primosomal protein N' [Chlamydiota bacterium]
MTKFAKYVSVVLDVALDKTLDYGVPAHLVDQVKRGMRVEVPVRGHKRSGYVFEIKDKPAFPRVLPIAGVLSDHELVTDDLFQLALWISEYYYAPLSRVLKVMLPSSIRKGIQPKQQLFVMRAETREKLRKLCADIRGKSPGQAAVLDVMLNVKKGILLSELLEKTKGSRSPVDTLVKKGCLLLDIVRVDRSPLVDEQYFRSKAKVLNEDQECALKSILESLENHRFQPHLLHGVTGSGKTEVYMQAIQHALKAGKGAIMLVPEISLTAQTIEQFRSRFEESIAILHHRLSHGERCDEWNNIRQGKAKIVIGARSAVFSPVQNLGLIIVDEEHEQSYKQSEEAPCYHARDVAVVRGKMTNSTVILGSATPSLESYFNAKSGKYALSHLRNRAETSSTPEVEIVDMKREFEKAQGFTNFSDTLLKGIKKRHATGEQTILFLNRRGYHTTLFCRECRQSVQCKHCDTTLTFHLGENTLSCHLCGYALTPPPNECPECQSPNPMKYRGVGTELLQKSLHAILPEIRTIRVDADTTRHKGSHQKLLHDFGTGKADVLIGTQMIAKGLHFPEVTLVGIINCDTSLNIPDFRASETVFQLITQVAGRAGRGVTPGEVALQTCMPENSTIKLAAKQDYIAFYNEEIAIREMFHFPPFCSMVKVMFSGTDKNITNSIATRFREQLLQKLTSNVELNPVIPAGHAKVKDKHRFQFLIRGPSIYPITRAIRSVQDHTRLPSKVRVFVDVNPLSTFF